jgi:hypothetical protein
MWVRLLLKNPRTKLQEPKNENHKSKNQKEPIVLFGIYLDLGICDLEFFTWIL